MFFREMMGSFILRCVKTSQEEENHPPVFLLLLAAAEMGCGLNKLEKRDDKRPGNIYSTLKRPQVETKIDVSYEYRFLEFTTLSTGEDGAQPNPGVGGLTGLRPNQRWRGCPGHAGRGGGRGLGLGALGGELQRVGLLRRACAQKSRFLGEIFHCFES